MLLIQELHCENHTLHHKPHFLGQQFGEIIIFNNVMSFDHSVWLLPFGGVWAGR